MMNSYNYCQNKDSSSPHYRKNWSSKWIMKQVMTALLFPSIAATYYFGYQSILMIASSIFVCVSLEWLIQKIIKRKSTITDGSAVITGWLLALTLPVTVPFWTLLIGDVIAIVFIKQFSGGIGKNVFNPAVFARVVLKLLFSPWITSWIMPHSDVVTTATPLAALGHFARDINKQTPSVKELFLGIDLGGPIGETCKLAFVIAGIYLIIKKVINPWIPVATIISFYSIVLIYSGFNFSFANAQALSGALFFSAVFMVTDYTSTPYTDKGRIIFAVGCGILTAVIRIVLDLPGGIGVAILVMNLLTPLINIYSHPKIYGMNIKYKRHVMS